MTAGADRRSLPVGARSNLGATAVVEITWLRNPCAQLDDLQSGLMSEVLDCAADGARVRTAGVMGVVVEGDPHPRRPPRAAASPAGARLTMDDTP